LERDFVLLNLNPGFDARLDEALKDFKLESPCVAILDADQRVVTFSGKLSARRERKQEALQKVLEKGCQRLNGDEIKQIVSQSAALGGGW
jgi:ribosomal protein S21